MEYPSERVEGSKRNTSLYKVNSHLYNQNITHKDKVYLRCILKKKLGCHGSAILSVTTNLAREKKGHNHSPEEYDFERLELVNGIKRLAEVSTDSLRNVYERAAGDHPLGHTIPFRQIESTLYKRRRLSDPLVPESASELAALLSHEKISGSQNFKAFAVHGNDHALIFFSDDVASSAADMKYIQFDATFQKVPQNYHQLLSILALTQSRGGNEKAFPAFYVLMTSASQGLYVEVLNVLLAVLPEFLPENVICDLEPQARNALSQTFPGIAFRGCFLQHCRCVWNTVKRFGLMQYFHNNTQFRRCMKRLMCLPLLPAEEIEKALGALCQEGSDMPSDGVPAYDRLTAYIRKCWIQDIGVEHVSFSNYETLIINDSDAHHKCLIRRVTGHSPKLWVFIGTIAKIIDNTEKEFRSKCPPRQRPKRKEINMDHIEDCKKCLQQGLFNPGEYLGSVVHVFEPYIDEVCGPCCATTSTEILDDPPHSEGDFQILINFKEGKL